MHPASVTNAVDRLQAGGLVRRQPHPTDGRATLAVITTRGRELAEAATNALNDQVFRAVGLERSDLDALVTVIRTLRQEAGDFHAPHD